MSLLLACQPQRSEFDVREMLADGLRIMAHEFLNYGRTDASVFHEAGGSMAQAVK